MVSFQTFWARLIAELNALPLEHGVHIGTARKWSQHSGDLRDDFVFFYRSGNVIYCGTTTTNNVRSISSAEFKKVYEVWDGYKRGEVPRSHIVHDLGVQNASWIIPLLKKYDRLMREG
jgi:hypothetical protein